MGIMADALHSAGLTTERQHAAQQKTEDNQRRKDGKKLAAKTGAAVDVLHSMQDFFAYARKELAHRYSPDVMKRLIREAHQVGDRLRLTPKKRKRMHAFLAKIDTQLRGLSNEERRNYLEAQFRDADPHHVEND